MATFFSTLLYWAVWISVVTILVLGTIVTTRRRNLEQVFHANFIKHYEFYFHEIQKIEIIFFWLVAMRGMNRSNDVSNVDATIVHHRSVFDVDRSIEYQTNCDISVSGNKKSIKIEKLGLALLQTVCRSIDGLTNRRWIVCLTDTPIDRCAC